MSRVWRGLRTGARPETDSRPGRAARPPPRVRVFAGAAPLRTAPPVPHAPALNGMRTGRVPARWASMTLVRIGDVKGWIPDELPRHEKRNVSCLPGPTAGAGTAARWRPTDHPPQGRPAPHMGAPETGRAAPEPIARAASSRGERPVVYPRREGLPVVPWHDIQYFSCINPASYCPRNIGCRHIGLPAFPQGGTGRAGQRVPRSGRRACGRLRRARHGAQPRRVCRARRHASARLRPYHPPSRLGARGCTVRPRSRGWEPGLLPPAKFPAVAGCGIPKTAPPASKTPYPMYPLPSGFGFLLFNEDFPAVILQGCISTPLYVCTNSGCTCSLSFHGILPFGLLVHDGSAGPRPGGPCCIRPSQLEGRSSC